MSTGTDPVEEACLGLTEAGASLKRDELDLDDLRSAERAMLHALGNVRRAKSGEKV